MRNTNQTMSRVGGLFISTFAGLLLAGCQSESTATQAPKPQIQVAPTQPIVGEEITSRPTSIPPANPGGAIRIDAGASAAFKDADGNLWLADTGFTDGETVDRGTDVKIENTKNPGLYTTERYDMTAFSYAVPNGQYMVNLHFAETYEDITGPGQRVFSFNVQGKEFKDFDVWARAGGARRAYVEKVPVTVTDGKVRITFTANVQSPEINAIEILPQR